MCRGVEKQSLVTPCSLQILLSTSWRTLSSNRRLPVACSEKYLQHQVSSMPSYFSNLISWAFSYPENRIFEKFHKNVYTMLPIPTFNSHLPAGFSRVVFIHWQHFWGLVEQSFLGWVSYHIVPATKPSASKYYMTMGQQLGFIPTTRSDFQD